MSFDPPTDKETLLCEGYLRKIRGWGQNRTRWFRLSGKSFAYFTKDAGELIGSVAVGEIESVKSVSKYQLCITTTVPFGKSNMLEMVLEAPSETVRERWESSLGMLQLQKMDGGPVAFGSDEDTLVAEGYLIKVQESLLALSRTRWFCLTRARFSYFSEEGGEFIAYCPLDNITYVGIEDETTFKVTAMQPFTKTGAAAVVLACRDTAERDRWLRCFDVLLPGKVCVSQYSPLPPAARAETDHFGVHISKSQSEKYLAQHSKDEGMSQGNRFIRDGDL
eukprot:m.453084 g.453084  ORF g.453084 m.453084 type:complete len:278 (-) comp20434_c0_seq1:107-940(-)